MSHPPPTARVLVLDPPPGGLDRLTDAIKQRGQPVLRSERADCLLDLLRDPTAQPATALVLIRQAGTPRSSLDALARLRALSRVPVVLFGGVLATPADRVAALEMGADDYLTPNMPLSEAMARLRAVLRRASWAGAMPLGQVVAPPEAPASRQIEGGWRLAPHRRSVVAADGADSVPLTGAEFELLRLLTTAGGEAVDREAISRTVFRRPWRVEDRAVDGLVKRVRRKLRSDAIATVRGVGYALRFADTGSSHAGVEICVPDTTGQAA